MTTQAPVVQDVSPKPSPSPAYWGFYWPLALTGIVTLLAQQLQNATLARYPDAANQLATFAIATGIFNLFDAALIFFPQLVNVLARSPEARSRCFRFTLAASAALTLPVVLLAVPLIGHPILARMFELDSAQVRTVSLYLALLSPNIFIVGLRYFYTGLIVQAKHTRIITILNVVYIGITWILLVVGLRAGWRPVLTLTIAQLVASVVHCIASQWAAKKLTDPTLVAEKEPLTWRAILSFFWPVALTSVMFAFSRPILYLYLARLPHPEPVLASMRVGFDFSMMFHNMLNQFRHLFVTFGKVDLPGVRRFMIRVTVVVTLGMIVVAFSPLSEWILRVLIGVKGEVLLQSRQVLMALCILPVLVSWRNYYHGLAMADRQTGPMGYGAVNRNLATYFGSAALYAVGWLNHLSASVILLLGFLAEALTVIYWPMLSRCFPKKRKPAD